MTKRRRRLTRRVPPCPCPVCGKPNDAATAVDRSGVRPQPGDASICLYCGTPLRYTADLTSRIMTDGEWLTMPEPLRSQMRTAKYDIDARLEAIRRAQDARRTGG